MMSDTHEALYRAIKEHCSLEDDSLLEVAQHGADAGWGGFTYTSDCVEFYDANEAAIYELLNETAERLAEIGRARIIVSGPHRREQVNGVLEEALGGLFEERFASATARRFEESAYVLWKGGAVEDARACLATARVFQEKTPADNPVARTMLEVLLEPVLSKLEEEIESEEERSLLVKP